MVAVKKVHRENSLPKCVRKRTSKGIRGNVSTTTTAANDVSEIAATLCCDNKSSLAQSKRRDLVANDGSWGDEENDSLFRAKVPGYYKIPDLEEDSRRVFVSPPKDKQSPIPDNAGDFDDSRVVRFKERSRTILAGAAHLLEDWEPKGLPHFGGEGGRDRDNTIDTQDDQDDMPDELNPPLLESSDAGGDTWWTGAWSAEQKYRLNFVLWLFEACGDIVWQLIL